MTRHYLDRLAEVIRTNWDQPALTDYATLDGGEGNSYTYGEMYGQICALCDRFRQLGIQKGDHIAICGANSANWVVAYLAIAAYQAVSVTILHSQTPEEIARQIDFADATTVIVDADIWVRLNQTQLSKVQHVLSLCDFSSLIDATTSPLVSLSFRPKDVSFDLQPLDTLAQICFTSGSTEQAKAVMLSLGNISAVVKCDSDVYACYQHTMLSFFPLAHIASNIEALVALYMESHVVCYKGSLSSHNLLDAWEKSQPFEICLVPLIASDLLSNRFIERFLSMATKMKYVTIMGALSMSEMERNMTMRHLSVINSYGTSETAATIGIATPSNYKLGASGRIISALECRIADNGEILVRGENVMLGYYKDPDATAAKIDKDGWLHTGDRGHLDEEGNLYVEGRLEQDMVVLPSGENISLPNVESIINQVDGVEESLVLARNGHLVALVYASVDLNRQDLLRTINPQLPSFSQLYDLEFVSTPFQRTEKRTLKRYLYQ